jgi:hypothetical protein
MADLSPEALARAHATIKAAPVFAEHAELIAGQTPDLPEHHTLVAIVSTDYEFTGTHVVPRPSLVSTVPELEGDGWAMVFSHRSDVEQIRHRAQEMADIAQKRIDMINRLRSRMN